MAVDVVLQQSNNREINFRKFAASVKMILRTTTRDCTFDLFTNLVEHGVSFAEQRSQSIGVLNDIQRQEQLHGVSAKDNEMKLDENEIHGYGTICLDFRRLFVSRYPSCALPVRL